MLTHKELSKLFSTKRISEISLGDNSFLEKVISHYKDHLGQNFLMKEVFDICYLDLQKNYRSEYFFKNTVMSKVLIGKHSPNTATALSEFRVGKSKADCVIVNGHSTCYEIKSEYDNFDRLDSQLHHYEKIFDKIYVVTATAHIDKIFQKDIPNIGIIELTPRNTLRTLREAKISDREIDARTVIRSLRVGEYTALVKKIYGRVPQLDNTEIFEVCEQLLIEASPSLVRHHFNDVIKLSRKTNGAFLKSLPKSLLMAGVANTLNNTQQINLITKLHNKL